MDADTAAKSTTTDGRPPALGLEHAGAPQPIGPNGQHGAYYVLKPEERAKGFVRPFRDAYVHAGTRPQHPLRDLTPEEQERFEQFGYVKFEKYPGDETVTGRFWTAQQLGAYGCGATTTMGREIAETYSRDPNYYSSTFCSKCRAHFPVAEFHWEINALQTTRELVGS